MSKRRWAGYGMAGVTGLAVVVAAVALTQKASRRAGTSPPVTIDTQAPLSRIAQQLRGGDAEALAVLYQRVMTRPEGEPKGLGDAEGKDWVAALAGMRTGFPRFSAYGRASALAAAARILDKFTVEPAPACWSEVLPPSHDLFTAGLADSAMNVRAAAVNEIARLWIYTPGRPLLPIEESSLGDWKEGFHAPVVRCLADPQPAMRAAAVACLAAIPVDDLAAPAAAYVSDPDPDVRRQVLVSFAARRSLLGDETILARLGDRDPRVPPLAGQVLKARGLTEDQIGLGGLIVHSKPELRESVIPMLASRTDIDPVVWLVHLSRDAVDSVRIKAAEALAEHGSSEARKRLAEMAVSDPSPAVKTMAGKLVAPGEQTASLPPLPGSASLTPKAN
jgi:hypothetical protein